MNGIKKISLLCIMLFSTVCAENADQYKIIRISPESLQHSVDIAKSQEDYRYMQKVVITTVAAACVIGLFQLQPYFAQNSKYVLKEGDVIVSLGSEVKSMIDQDNSNFLYTYMCAVGKNIAENSIYFTKNIGAAVSSCIGMFMLNTASQQISSSWKYLYDVDSLRGFIEHQTNLDKLFFMLKEFAVPFDLYSQRLSMDVNFGQQRIVLAEFMQEIIRIAETSNSLNKGAIVSAMKKDYLRKTSSLEELQDLALQAINYRQQIEQGLVTTPLQIEQFNRATIAEFCNFLILDIEKITAFVTNKSQDQYIKLLYADKIQSLVSATNLFAAQLEEKLACSLDDLYQQSKQGHGLFDLIYNFQMIVNQHIEIMGYRL